MTSQPRIGVVVLHYGADELTLRCLRALVADDRSPATRIVLVDNGPGVGFGARVRAQLPTITVVEPGENLGFAAGCNLGVRTLGDDADLVALVNSDVLVAPGWLTPLLKVLEDDPQVAAACPKIRFEGRFRRVDISADTSWTPGRGDSRHLAWRLRGVRAGADDFTDRSQRVAGFWEPDGVGEWAGPAATLHVPDTGADSVVLLAEAPPDVDVTLRAAGTTSVLPAGTITELVVPLVGHAFAVINNVGNEWRPDGYGVDLGFMEPDVGQHDEPAEVPAWCGGAVLLRRSYLEQTGGFDERLFLYYEDLELSIRGARLGWRYRYEPRSVVEHRHAASFASDPVGIARRRERNRLLVLLRHGTTQQVALELVRFVLVTLSYLRRDVVAPVLRSRRPRTAIVRSRLGALRGAAALGPAMLRDRRRPPRP
jgi:GT2 family glycosyltransferase